MRVLTYLLFLFFVFGNNIVGQTSYVGSGGGAVDISSAGACLSAMERDEIKLQLHANIEELEEGIDFMNTRLNADAVVIFDWPLRMVPNQLFDSYFSLSYFVDHNPEATGSEFGTSNLDYNCGNRTYDNSDGYNHAGTDFSLWPFPWYMVDSNVVEVIAAETGTIIGKDDGNDDDHCSCFGSWNAVYVMHADGSVAWYGHLKKNSLTTKSVGDMVAKGEFLGIVASSGCSSSPHLHFEVYGTDDNLIDPFDGDCNSMNASSWWASQEPYLKPTLNALLTHSAAPVFGCTSAVEQTNFSNCFNPGQPVYTAFYYRDQEIGDVVNMRISYPDGTVWNNWSQTFTNAYRESYWYWWWNFPTAGPYGIWTLEADFKGETSRYEFVYTDGDCGCPISFSSSNNSELSGEQNVDADYESFGRIESTQVITGTATVHYDSGIAICLEPGFEVNAGAIFEAFIDGCGNQ